MELTRVESYEHDERFYKRVQNGVAVYAPSVTHIIHTCYPQGDSLSKWIGDVGNKRAEQIRDEAAEDGSFTHDAIETMLKGGRIDGKAIAHKFPPKRSLKIKRSLKAFIEWHTEHQPVAIATEEMVWGTRKGNAFAGTLDFYCKIGGEEYIVDFKTSNSVHNSHKVQLMAYGEAYAPNAKKAILHLGNRTRKGWTFTVLNAKHEARFLKEWWATYDMFVTMHPTLKPRKSEFPEVFQLQTGGE